MTNLELVNKVKDLYQLGFSKHRIQSELGLTKKQIDTIAAENGMHFITRSEIQDRNQRMLDLRNQGWSLEAIGKEFEVNGSPMTKEGVRLALKNATQNGGDLKVLRGKSPDKENKHTTRFQSRQSEAIALFESGVEEEEIAAKLQVCEKTVSSYLRNLPKYKEKHSIKNQPIKSTLSYPEIVKLRKAGKSPKEIAELAKISIPRVLQIIQMYGNYNPSAKTVERIKRIKIARSQNERIIEIAKREKITEGQVYRYLNLAKAPEEAGKL